MTVQLTAVVVDAAAPGELAQFWAHALGWNVREADGPDIELIPTDVTTFSLLFRAAAREKVGQNRIHFDLTTASVEDQDNTVTELLERGASHVDVGQTPDEGHVVLADPEGNEFCIIEPQNQFLASCPRLGAVNCDGTRALGHFFSDALGWPLVWDQDEETAIQAPDGTGPKITWSGPPLMPQLGEVRFHLHTAPTPGSSMQAALDHLLALGASRVDGANECAGAIGLADVDGNRFCLVDSERPAVNGT
jgi:predicted enzyme related to lactoylglutathione lyase